MPRPPSSPALPSARSCRRPKRTTTRTFAWSVALSSLHPRASCRRTELMLREALLKCNVLLHVAHADTEILRGAKRLTHPRTSGKAIREYRRADPAQGAAGQAYSPRQRRLAPRENPA